MKKGMNLRQMNRTQVSSFICCSCLRSCAQGFLFIFFFLSRSWMSQKSEVYGSHVWTMFLSVLNKTCKLANKPNGYLNIFRMYHSRTHSVLLCRGRKTSSVLQEFMHCGSNGTYGKRETQTNGYNLWSKNLNMPKWVAACIWFIGFSYWPLNSCVKNRKVFRSNRYHHF